jgi:hypothetical protein
MIPNIDKEVEKRLGELFKINSPEDIAKHIRQSNYVLALSFIRSNEAENYIDPKQADDCFYWLNELAEALEPVLNNNYGI